MTEGLQRRFTARRTEDAFSSDGEEARRRMMPRISIPPRDPVLPFQLPWQERGRFGDALSDREIEILAEVARGKPNKQTAVVLGISEQTVKNHVSSILAKFGVPDRTAAVVVAIHRGILQLEGVGGDPNEAKAYQAGLILGRCNIIALRLAAIHTEETSLREQAASIRTAVTA